MRLRWACAAGFIAMALVGGGKWLFDRQQQASQQRAEHLETQRLAQALDRPVNLQFDGPRTVQSWLDEFTRQTGMPVRFHHCDEPTLAERQTRLLTLRQSAREALLRLGDEQGLHWHPDNELTIHIYSPHSTTQPPVEVWTHQLPLPLHGGAEESLAVLAEDHWPSPHVGSSIVASPGQWIVTQPYDVQLRIQQFLQKLKTHLKDVADVPTPGLLPNDPRLAPRRFDPQPEAALNIQAALDRRMSLDVKDEPLLYVITRIAHEAGVPIVLTKKIEDAGVHPEMPVTFRANNLRVGAILRHLLSERNLTYITNETSLHITTVDDSLSPDHLVMIAYPVPDFGPSGQTSEYEELVELIRCLLLDDLGHPFSVGRIYKFRDLLLVSNREEVHEQITNLLHALRSVRAREQRTANIKTSPQRDRTLAILQQPCELKYNDVPLNEVVADIERRTGVPIFLLWKMQDAGVQPDQRITCELAPRPLEENLHRILPGKDLSVALDDELVIITTVEDAHMPEHVETEVIDLRPLGKHWWPDELGNLIQVSIEPNSWETVGNGRFEFGAGVLVIRQRRDVVAQVHHLLSVLEQHTQSDAPRTERGNLLAKMPFVFGEGERSGLYDVRDLLKPQGKFTVDTLLQELHDDTLEPRFSNPFISIHRHSNQLLSAHLRPEDLRVLEARLEQLRR